MYLDGALTASTSNTPTEANSKWMWRIGNDSLKGWPNVPSGQPSAAGNAFNGYLQWGALHMNTALTSSQVAAHYADGRP